MIKRVTTSDLTQDMVRGVREAKRISREDFESWTYDPAAAQRVCAAINDCQRANWLSHIDDPIGGLP